MGRYTLTHRQANIGPDKFVLAMQPLKELDYAIQILLIETDPLG